MNIELSLFSSFLFFILFYMFLRLNRYKHFSSFYLSYMISLFILNVLYPPTSEDLNDINSWTSLYVFFQALGILLLFIYSFSMALNDLEEE